MFHQNKVLQKSSHNTDMHYDSVKGCEHANIKEVGFVPHCCYQEERQLLKNG
jgi:hypothetical protein